MSLTLLTPLGLLVMLVGLVPLVALVLTRRRAERVREALRLERAGGPPILPGIAIALLAALIGVAAAQPAVRTSDARKVRTDAQAFYVFDTSRSMLASSGAEAPTRLDRAERIALRVRSDLDGVPSGIATLTDRVLPDLFPTSDDEVFTATVEQSVGIDRPPPRGLDLVTTLFAAFDSMAGDNFFDAGVKKRVVVFFTDGESAPYDREALRQVFRPRAAAAGDSSVGSLGGDQPAKPHRPILTHFVVMRIGNVREKVHYRGKVVPLYKADPQSARITLDFADAVDGTVVGEGDVGGMVAAVQAALGDGPLQSSGRTLRVVPLAKWFLVAALVPLLGLLWRRNLV